MNNTLDPGEYALVERPRRQVYTWRWEGMPADGWGGCLDNLARRVFGGG